MSILNKIFKGADEGRISLSTPEAFAAIAVSAISADGYMRDGERDRIVVLLSELPLFQGYSQQRLTNLLEKLFELLSVKGTYSLLAIAREFLPAELQEPVFVVVSDLLLVDGVLSAKEREFLTHLWQMLDLPADRASQIFEQKVEEYNLRTPQKK
ncbi:MAG: tellurite resistance TerB family protein [Limnospira sp.]